MNSQAASISFHAEMLDLWKQIAALEAKKGEREVEDAVEVNETLKEIETKQALAEAKNKQSSDVPEENDSEDITDEVFNEDDVEGIETKDIVINESLNVVDFVEDKSKNTNDVDTNEEVHNCVEKGF